jgi:midasin
LEDEEEGQPIAKISKFVYTGCTVRLLEQICQGIRMNEPMLLVGETGTGKTTAVQEVAHLLG